MRSLLLVGSCLGAALFGACASDPEPASTAAEEVRGGDANHGHDHGHGPRQPKLTAQTSGTTNRLQAISPVDDHVVWASGTGGTFVVTKNGGRTWKVGVVAGAETLEFRDVEGISERVAYLLSAGPGDASRIYKTTDGGESWTLQFTNQDPNGFYDCFAFWNRRRAIVMGDSVAGRFPILRTENGRTWTDIGDNLPPAQTGEAAFAASGTCAAVFGERQAWITTGGAATARVLLTTDGGDSWDAVETPIIQGTPSSGGTSIAFRDRRHGVLGGGELAAPDELSPNFARSHDGGRTWELAEGTPFTGSIYGLAYATGRDRGGWDFDFPFWGHDHDDRTVVATGPGGAAWTPDEGDTWYAFPDDVTNYWATAFASEHTGWLVGTAGRILRVDF